MEFQFRHFQLMSVKSFFNQICEIVSLFGHADKYKDILMQPLWAGTLFCQHQAQGTSSHCLSVQM